ncbi:uncharacterized protein RJT21DRAFT_110353 [Scheffersomyces amazonensis]|uniref:uncharacterized protein n=1 Tax=Scheffersomyces amazonensis TaxID=1078765 RepID=UPI00315D1996
MSDVKLARTIQRFKAKIDTGSYYEAHQTLRTIVNRYVKSNQFKEAIDLLYEGSLILIKNKQYASSSDLITYLITVYEQFNISPSEGDYKLKLIELINSLPSNETSLPDLAKQIIQWSRNDIDKFGDNELHHVFGVKFLKAVQDEVEDDQLEISKEIKSEDDRYKLFTIAELHLILGTYNSVPLYVNYLYKWYEASSESDVDPGLFLSRAIINYGYLKNLKFIKDARDIFITKLITKHTSYEESSRIYYYEKFPLLTFLQLLILTLEKENSTNKFLKLYDQYKPLLKAYEILPSIEYLGKVYFNVSLGSANNQGNLLSSLMGDLFK